MKLGLFDVFLRETKESDKETWRSASRSELFIKVNDYWGYKMCHIDVMQRHTMWTSICALHTHALWPQATKFNIVETLKPAAHDACFPGLLAF